MAAPIKGGKGNDVLNGGAGNDRISGMAGNDLLSGGAGADMYIVGRGQGADVIDNTGGGADGDTVLFTNGVTQDQLWFSSDGIDLTIGVIGTTDEAMVKDWYVGGGANQVASIELTGGLSVSSAGVDVLVSAMAGMTPPPVGQTNLTTAEHTALDPVIAANWV